MKPLRLLDSDNGNHSLLLDAGTTEVDGLVDELGHEANGYFWEGIAQLLITSEAPHLAERLDFDPEGSMFCAYGEDLAALEELGALMSQAARDPERMRQLVALAESTGFEFDD